VDKFRGSSSPSPSKRSPCTFVWLIALDKGRFNPDIRLSKLGLRMVAVRRKRFAE